jgi:tetratricopeptide (TPR) repeat protein
MKIVSLRFALLLALTLTLLTPTLSFSDQNDARLDAFFATLKTTDNASVSQEAELNIWAIWFESGSDQVDSLMEEAGTAVQSHQLAQAEEIYSRVVKLAPEFSEGWNRRATVRYYQEDYGGSLRDIQQTLALEPRHFGAVWGLGMILGWERDFSGAITAFERLLEINPHASDAKPRIERLKQELAKSAV